MEAIDRIELNPAICSGKPIISGTRMMVRNILGMKAASLANRYREHGDSLDALV